MRRNTLTLVTVIAISILMSGCGFTRERTERKNNVYKQAVQEHPLEVPPDLERPDTSGALMVPEVSASAAAPATAGAPPMEVTPVIGGVTLGGDGLQVKDTQASTWSRVGMALERSGVATIISRDESTFSYQIQTTGQTVEKAGWFKNAVTLGHADKKVAAPVQLTLRVSADGSGSLVRIEGAAGEAGQSAARTVLAKLKERLS